MRGIQDYEWDVGPGWRETIAAQVYRMDGVTVGLVLEEVTTKNGRLVLHYNSPDRLLEDAERQVLGEVLRQLNNVLEEVCERCGRNGATVRLRETPRLQVCCNGCASLALQQWKREWLVLPEPAELEGMAVPRDRVARAMREVLHQAQGHPWEGLVDEAAIVR